MKQNIRIVTYNIHKCKGLDLKVSPQRIADVLAEIDADIIALQEVLSVRNERAEEDQVRYIAEELGIGYRLGENRRLHGGAYGNAVLSRLPIIETKNFDITVRGREPRGCLHADIDTGRHGLLHIYNLHLGTAFFERRRQIKILLDRELLNRQHPAPRVLLGDFNEWTNGLTSRLLKSHFHPDGLRKLLIRKRTYPGIFPLMHLDHIYYDNHLKMVDAFLHRSRTALVASDHLPLVADFQFVH